MEDSSIKIIRENTKIAEDILFKVYQMCRPGISTYEMDVVAKQEMEGRRIFSGTTHLGYSCHISIALNDQVFFGSIDKRLKIKEGDVVKLSSSIFRNGLFTDIGFSFIVGDTSDEKRELLKSTALAFSNALKVIKVGTDIKKISENI